MSDILRSLQPPSPCLVMSRASGSVFSFNLHTVKSMVTNCTTKSRRRSLMPSPNPEAALMTTTSSQSSIAEQQGCDREAGEKGTNADLAAASRHHDQPAMVAAAYNVFRLPFRGLQGPTSTRARVTASSGRELHTPAPAFFEVAAMSRFSLVWSGSPDG